MILSNDTSESNLVNGIYYTTDNSGYGFAIGKIVAGTKTKQFVVRDSGNILINTQSDAGYKLDVNGTGRFSSELQAPRFFSIGSLNNSNGSFLIDHPGVQTWKIGVTSSNTSSFVIGNDVGGSFVTKVLTLAQSGAASFSSTVSAIGGFSFPYGQGGIKATGYTYTDILVNGYDPSAGDFVDFYTAGSGSSNATKKIRILNNGTTTFYGNVYAPGFFNSSDIRLKELIDYDYSVSEIKPITYLWKNGKDKQKHVGYSAQEVQKVMPDAVNEDENGYLSVNYIEVLVAKIAAMEKEIELLKSK
jgi:hypothetical protein